MIDTRGATSSATLRLRRSTKMGTWSVHHHRSIAPSTRRCFYHQVTMPSGYPRESIRTFYRCSFLVANTSHAQRVKSCVMAKPELLHSLESNIDRAVRKYKYYPNAADDARHRYPTELHKLSPYQYQTESRRVLRRQSHHAHHTIPTRRIPPILGKRERYYTPHVPRAASHPRPPCTRT